MFNILDRSNIIGFDTETGIRFTASDTDLIEFSHFLPDHLQITDYADAYDCYAAVVKAAAYISQNEKVLEAFKKSVPEYKGLERAIKEYALKCLHPQDKLQDYDLISKITYPRFGCLVGCDFSQIRDFKKSGSIFESEAKEYFIMKDHSINFIDYIIGRIKKGDNFAIVTFNMEYDFNALLCNVPPTYLSDNGIIDERLPTKIHSDKTITWKNEDKNNKGRCKWVDAMLLAEKGMSINKYGQIASRIYQKDYKKLDTYDYSKIIYDISDLYPSLEELEYCYRDVQLALWGLAYLLRQHVEVLDKCDLLNKPSDLPITCSHLYDMVNVINTLNVDLSINKSKRKKFFSTYKKNNARNNEIHYNPRDKYLYDYIKKGFGGGKISFNPLFLEEKISGGHGYSLDLCSAYPFQIVNVYPDMNTVKKINDVYFFKKLNKCLEIAFEIESGNFVNLIPKFKYGFTARIAFNSLKIKKGVQLPLVGNLDGGCKLIGHYKLIRNRLLYADRLEITVTHADLITILAGYEYISISFISGFAYELKPMNVNLRRKFVKAADFKSRLKEWTKKDHHEVIKKYTEFNELVGQSLLTRKEKEAEVKQIITDAYQNSKVLFNGIYGKACQSLIHNKKYIDEYGEIHITEDEYKPRQGTCYTTGRYIATYTRLHLVMAFFIALNSIKEKDLILYAHTDSLKLFLFSNDHEKIIKNILNKFNAGIVEELDYFLKNCLRFSKSSSEEEIKKAYSIYKENKIGFLEDEKNNRFNKVVVCGNMRILTENEMGECHITFSGINVPYVLSGGKNKYDPNKLNKYMKEQGIFKLYDQFFSSGKKYTLFESCKTTLDYKHYNMILNEEFGHICQTIKELPIEINGNTDQLVDDKKNVEWLRRLNYAY